MSDADKGTKILRTLPPSFDALAMESSSNSNTFDEIINAVQANIERQNKLGLWKPSSGGPSTPSPSVNFPYGSFIDGDKTGNYHRGRGRGRERGTRGGRGGGKGGRFRPGNSNDSRTCHYCGRSGHFIKVCRFRLSDEFSGQIRKPNNHQHLNQDTNQPY